MSEVCFSEACEPGVLPKVRTGVQGLDEITGGGLPRGRPTLVAGGAGSGKTMLAMEFLAHGAAEFNEPGIFLAFEETKEDIIMNFRSIGLDLEGLIEEKKLFIDHLHLDQREIHEAGDFDLEGLFLRLSVAVEAIGAKRVAIDTIEILFAAFENHAVIRSELQRLFRWLKDRELTAIVTGERGENTITRYGLEEYVADCVIVLDTRVKDEVTTRRLRILKYRGSTHGMDEYPFLIDEDGFSILPISSIALQQGASDELISTGIPRLDTMLGGGVYRGSSILISGTAGMGKSTMAAQFADASCRRGQSVLYFAFEESAAQIIRNMRSVGLDLSSWVEDGLLEFHASRPTQCGLELHLVNLHKVVSAFQPDLVVIDPLSNLTTIGDDRQVRMMLTRLIDFLKGQGITAVFTDLTAAEMNLEKTEIGISSLMDTWILLKNLEHNGERNRGLYVIKSRGMAHSNQIREFVITGSGVQLVDVYIGPGGVLAGSSRVAQESRDHAEALMRRQEADAQRRALDRKRKSLDAQIALLTAEYEEAEDEYEQRVRDEELRAEAEADSMREQARRRRADHEVGA